MATKKKVRRIVFGGIEGMIESLGEVLYNFEGLYEFTVKEEKAKV